MESAAGIGRNQIYQYYSQPFMRSKKGENHRQNASQNTKTAATAVRCTFATLVLIDTVFLSGIVQMVTPDVA
jgi:hypothetical protein